MNKLALKLLRFLSSPPDPKRQVRFGGKWIDGNLPIPTACTSFFGHVTHSDIQVLFGVSNFVTEEVHPASIVSLSPQKLKELHQFLSNVIKAYEDKYGIIEMPPTSPPPTTIH